ncbi:MAG TPA: hypothetical protein VF329_00020 [Gammaproteobacteria bacterium]
MSGPTPRFPHHAVAVASSLALIGSSAFAGGRPSETERSWFPEFSGGWAFAQSDTNDVLDDDFTLSGGALFWPQNWAGIGYNLEAGDGQFFVEAKYHRIETDARDLEFVPVNFGFRW